MSKVSGKTIIVHDDTLFGKFQMDDYEHCTFLFKNCTFINFRFYSRTNTIELLGENRFCESIDLDAPRVVLRETVNTDNLISLSINGGYFKMLEGTALKALGPISITSDIQSFHKNKLETYASLTLQSSHGMTSYENSELIGKTGVKISSLRGNLKIENCTIDASESKLKDTEKEKINGVYLACYGVSTHMQLENNMITTDVLEIIHPNEIIVQKTELYKRGDYGRFFSRNHENPRQVQSHSYIDSETQLDQFYQSKTEENKIKILELFGLKKAA